MSFIFKAFHDILTALLIQQIPARLNEWRGRTNHPIYDIIKERILEPAESVTQFLSIKSLSRCLDISEDTIRTWVRKKNIPYYKIGKLIRFDLIEVRRRMEKVDLEQQKRNIYRELKLHAKI